ncbi:fibrous sheath CABYR-binding like protein [Babesia ovata]|uniref:Fibrous sheath CABYR-binding like protein n=1 Tax=Babesia ovata TaxID=189622 RepID=A0A2H6KFM8_9APIC|nr:fibrous sheath CABYR-binding like protein [Babesia ovata]GBE61795.1 fibrous sheath CABYR-binding like protein [Babesia ovata]
MDVNGRENSKEEHTEPMRDTPAEPTMHDAEPENMIDDVESPVPNNGRGDNERRPSYVNSPIIETNVGETIVTIATNAAETIGTNVTNAVEKIIATKDVEEAIGTIATNAAETIGTNVSNAVESEVRRESNFSHNGYETARYHDDVPANNYIRPDVTITTLSPDHDEEEEGIFMNPLDPRIDDHQFKLRMFAIFGFLPFFWVGWLFGTIYGMVNKGTKRIHKKLTLLLAQLTFIGGVLITVITIVLYFSLRPVEKAAATLPSPVTLPVVLSPVEVLYPPMGDGPLVIVPKKVVPEEEATDEVLYPPMGDGPLVVVPKKVVPEKKLLDEAPEEVLYPPMGDGPLVVVPKKVVPEEAPEEVLYPPMGDGPLVIVPKKVVPKEEATDEVLYPPMGDGPLVIVPKKVVPKEVVPEEERPEEVLYPPMGDGPLVVVPKKVVPEKKLLDEAPEEVLYPPMGDGPLVVVPKKEPEQVLYPPMADGTLVIAQPSVYPYTRCGAYKVDLLKSTLEGQLESSCSVPHTDGTTQSTTVFIFKGLHDTWKNDKMFTKLFDELDDVYAANIIETEALSTAVLTKVEESSYGLPMLDEIFKCLDVKAKSKIHLVAMFDNKDAAAFKPPKSDPFETIVAINTMEKGGEDLGSSVIPSHVGIVNKKYQCKDKSLDFPLEVKNPEGYTYVERKTGYEDLARLLNGASLRSSSGSKSVDVKYSFQTHKLLESTHEALKSLKEFAKSKGPGYDRVKFASCIAMPEPMKIDEYNPWL